MRLGEEKEELTNRGSTAFSKSARSAVHTTRNTRNPKDDNPMRMIATSTVSLIALLVLAVPATAQDEETAAAFNGAAAELRAIGYNLEIGLAAGSTGERRTAEQMDLDSFRESLPRIPSETLERVVRIVCRIAVALQVESISLTLSAVFVSTTIQFDVSNCTENTALN